jgi:hypothetical protein
MHRPGRVTSWPLSSGGDLFIIPGVWKVDTCYLWAICPLSQEIGKLASVFCGRFVHYPKSLKSWHLLSVGDLSIISGVGKVGCCYLWMICPLSQEIGKLAIVFCGRFVHYPRSLKSWLLLSMGDFSIISGVWKVDCCYLWVICSLSQQSGTLTSVTCWGDIVVYANINGIICHAELIWYNTDVASVAPRLKK